MTLLHFIILTLRERNKQNNETIFSQIIKTKKELNNVPVIANVDFGHTDPKVTLPIGGVVELVANSTNSKITILKH